MAVPKVIFNTFLGILSSTSGVYIGYLYLESLNENSRPWLLLLSLPLVALGVFLLVQASRSGAPLNIKDGETTSGMPSTAGKFENLLKKNNELADEWSKTVEDKDKLKILEIAAAAEEQMQKELS
jgi:hypothetical protein